MIVRESIEFQRGLDPKKSLGLGIREQILNYARQKCQEGDFSWSSPSGWKWEIQEDKNIPLQTKYAWFDYLEEHPEYLQISMDEHGNLTEAVNFERGLSPKTSMKIGNWKPLKIKEAILKLAKEKNVKPRIFDKDPGSFSMGFTYRKVMTLFIEINDSYDKEFVVGYEDLQIAADEREEYDTIEECIEWIKNKMDYVDENWEENEIDEAINFERGLSPKTSMSIGIKEKIRAFMEEFGNNTEEHWLSDLIQQNLQSDWIDSFDDETRIAWINYLLKTPGEWLRNLDENDYIQMKEEGIEWIPYIPIPGNDFKYQLIGNNYTIKFSGWEEFSTYFDTAKDLSFEFIENVLSGDAHDDFYYDSDAYSITDLGWHIQRIINKGEKVPAIDDLKEKAIELGGNPENMETIDDLLQEINDNDDLHDLRQAVLFAFLDAQESADESAAYKSLIKAIQKWYEIGEGEWKEVGTASNISNIPIMVAPISKKGLEKLFYTIMTGDDKIRYYPPDQGYNGDISKDDINDAIYNKIEDL